MMPMKGMNPKQMQKLMKQLGIKMEELEGVKEVVIKLENKEIIIKDATVTVITAMGEKSYQIVGKEEVREVLNIPEEDIKLVMEQANVDYETAKKALEETKGPYASFQNLSIASIIQVTVLTTCLCSIRYLCERFLYYVCTLYNEYLRLGGANAKVDSIVCGWIVVFE